MLAAAHDRVPPAVEAGDDPHGFGLAKILEDVKPNRLGTTSHSRYVAHITRIVSNSLIQNSAHLLILIQAVKECHQPCYKRDLLLETLDLIVFRDGTLFAILCDTVKKTNPNFPWKEMANSIIALPELVANCGKLEKFPQFKPSEFFTHLLALLYRAFENLEEDQQILDIVLAVEQKCFFTQLLGRVAISGHSHLVWKKFTHRMIHEPRESIKRLLVTIFSLPLQSGVHESTQFDLFVEPLYLPIFHYLRPTCDSGTLIRSLLGEAVLNSEKLKYILCNKSLFQTNYNLDMSRQSVILTNIFSYLSSVGAYTNQVQCSENFVESKNIEMSLLINVLVEIATSWSNGTKILLRKYEHNRYVSCALLVAFKFAFEHDRNQLILHADEIQSKIMKGFQVYLNRASSDQRNLAMCLGELIFAKLHKLFESNLKAGVDPQRERQIEQLSFDVEWNDDCSRMRNLFEQDLNELFPDELVIKELEEKTPTTKACEESSARDRKNIIDANKISLNPSLCRLPVDQGVTNTVNEATLSANTSRRAVVEAEGDDDDLKPYDIDDEDDVADNDLVANDANVRNVPIYLRDCISGLLENNDPRYVKLCLIKAGELISEISNERKASDLVEASSRQTRILNQYNRTVRAAKPSVENDEIRDIAIELAQILLYLDDQYNIDGFTKYRIASMSSLCIASPEIVAKYLLDEFNGSSRNTRHQLDILQVLVASAKQLSGNEFEQNKEGNKADERRANNARREINQRGNRFVKFASLYFYGIINRLKTNLIEGDLNSPKTIISAVKSIAGSSGVASGRESVIRRVIGGLAQSRSHLNTNNLLGLSSKTLPVTDFCNEISTKQGQHQANYRTAAIASERDLRQESTRPGEESKRGNQRFWIDDGERLTRQEDQLDDSYLLSRILFSISLIIKCLHQQPIVCRLSNDLLDTLAAYRRHPDTGVRRALVSCLTVVRDCTPSVYFEEYLHDKTVHLFGTWLACEAELIKEL